MNLHPSPEDETLIIGIAKRAVKIAIGADPDRSRSISTLDLILPLGACHLNGCPLNLAELATAKDSDLAHDVFGIARHIDTETGALCDGFYPRYAART